LHIYQKQIRDDLLIDVAQKVNELKTIYKVRLKKQEVFFYDHTKYKIQETDCRRISIIKRSSKQSGDPVCVEPQGDQSCYYLP